MNCTKCGSHLIDGSCPFCIDVDKIIKEKEILIYEKKNNTIEKVLLTLSMTSALISIFPIHLIIIILGIILAIITIVTSLKLRLKSTINDISIILSIVSIISLFVWIYFLYFIAHKL